MIKIAVSNKAIQDLIKLIKTTDGFDSQWNITDYIALDIVDNAITISRIIDKSRAVNFTIPAVVTGLELDNPTIVLPVKQFYKIFTVYKGSYWHISDNTSNYTITFFNGKSLALESVPFENDIYIELALSLRKIKTQLVEPSFTLNLGFNNQIYRRFLPTMSKESDRPFEYQCVLSQNETSTIIGYTNGYYAMICNIDPIAVGLPNNILIDKIVCTLMSKTECKMTLNYTDNLAHYNLKSNPVEIDFYTSVHEFVHDQIPDTIRRYNVLPEDSPSCNTKDLLLELKLLEAECGFDIHKVALLDETITAIGFDDNSFTRNTTIAYYSKTTHTYNFKYLVNILKAVDGVAQVYLNKTHIVFNQGKYSFMLMGIRNESDDE